MKIHSKNAFTDYVMLESKNLIVKYKIDFVNYQWLFSSFSSLLKHHHANVIKEISFMFFFSQKLINHTCSYFCFCKDAFTTLIYSSFAFVRSAVCWFDFIANNHRKLIDGLFDCLQKATVIRLFDTSVHMFISSHIHISNI